MLLFQWYNLHAVTFLKPYRTIKEGVPAVIKPTIVLSLAAGLLGGMLSRYLTPMPVHAQAPPSPAAAAAGAQTLRLPVALVDQAGNMVGSFTMDPDGKPNIRLYESSPQAKGWPRVIWTARGVTLQPATGQ
jgi:hypothetical protein